MFVEIKSKEEEKKRLRLDTEATSARLQREIADLKAAVSSHDGAYARVSDLH